jgi:HlyD family secretion protein
MDDYNFVSGELVTTKINNNGHIVPLSKDNIDQTSGALVPFFPERDYALVQESSPEEFLPAIGRWVKIGGVVLVGIFGAATALTTVLKYKVTVQAPAAIRPVGELRLVQSPIEGAVLTIPVQENQTVRAGDIIATIQDLRQQSKLKTKRSQLSGDIEKGKQQIAGIDAQILALDRQQAAETEQSERAIASIQAELNRAQRDYRDKQITTQTEVNEAEANLQTAQREREAAEVELQVAAANLKSIEQGYNVAQTRFYRYQTYPGAISKNQLEEAQAAAEQQKYAIDAQIATIAKQKRLVARLAAQAQASQARLERTQAALNPSGAELELIQQKIKRERANAKTAIARLQQEREKLRQQQIEIGNQIATNQKEIAQLDTELKPMPIRAPIAGTLQELAVRNPLQILHPGDRVAHIVPEHAPLQIKATVSAGDIDNVKVGQMVQMRVSACPYTDRGVLGGQVTHVAADARTSESKASENAPQQAVNKANGIYEVTIQPNALTLGKGATKCHLKAGMEGRADIISKEETVFQFMLRKARLLVDP